MKAQEQLSAKKKYCETNFDHDCTQQPLSRQQEHGSKSILTNYSRVSSPSRSTSSNTLDSNLDNSSHYHFYGSISVKDAIGSKSLKASSSFYNSGTDPYYSHPDEERTSAPNSGLLLSDLGTRCSGSSSSSSISNDSNNNGRASEFNHHSFISSVDVNICTGIDQLPGIIELIPPTPTPTRISTDIEQSEEIKSHKEMPKQRQRGDGRRNSSRPPSESEMVGLLNKNVTFTNDAGSEDSDDSYYNDDDNNRRNLRSRNLTRKALNSLAGREIHTGVTTSSRSTISNSLMSRHSFSAGTGSTDEVPLLPPFRRSQSLFHSASGSAYIEHDIDEDNFANQFLSRVDEFEDEFDRQAYEELIPFNIRMELENRLFGWNHLFSEFLGHTLFPLFYYLITFWTISVFGLKYEPPSGEHCSIPAALLKKNCPADDRCGWNCFFHKISFHGHTNDDESNEYHYVPIFGLSVGAFLFLRQLFSLWSALNAFRTVRRRRRVWLRSTAAEYFKDKKRQEEIKEVDKKTLLGKMRKKLQVRRVRKKIKNAEKRFEKRDRIRRNKFIRNSSSFENEHHKLVQRLGKTDQDRKKRSNRDDNEKNYDLHNPSDGVKDLSRPSHTTSDIADDFLEVYQKYKRDSQSSNSKENDESQRNFYARTMPTYAMQSINMDQIRLKSRIENVPYAHGGFFGAAPFMLANPHWIDILRRLMPDVYVEISRRAVRAPVPQLIHWAENNPVVAAYGTAHELEFSGQVPTLEWDVFLDPHLVQRVEIVLQARDTFIKELMKTSKRIDSLMSRESGQSRYADKIKAVGVILESGATTRSNERRILEFYNAEINKRVEVLLEQMLIAHGNISQLTLEQTGILKQFNFSRVKHTRRTLGGGIFAKQWIQTFVEALKMSTKSDSFPPTDESTSSASGHDSSSSVEPCPSDDKEDLPLIENSEHSLRREGASFHDLALAAIAPLSITDAIEELKQVTECEAPLGLVLDIKSRHVPKRVWALLLDALRKAGARVEGIATFFVEDIRDISKFCSVGVNEIIFHHSAGDVQHACHDGTIKQGDCVFFNGGSLFWNHMSGVKDFSNMFGSCLSFDVEQVKKQYKLQPYARIHHRRGDCRNYEKEEGGEDDMQFIDTQSSTIQQYKDHFGLSLGIYVQEFCVDDEILEIIIDYVNRNQHIFNLGFSWGGVNGMTVQGIQPGRFTNTDGLWNQRYIGKKWDYDRYPTTIAQISDTQIT